MATVPNNITIWSMTMNKKLRFIPLRQLKTGHPNKKRITAVRGVQFKDSKYIVWEYKTTSGWVTHGLLTLSRAK